MVSISSSAMLGNNHLNNIIDGNCNNDDDDDDCDDDHDDDDDDCDDDYDTHTHTTYTTRSMVPVQLPVSVFLGPLL